MHEGVRTAAVLLAVLVIAGMPNTVSAQSLTGSVTGTVKDEQQAVLPGVTVTLIGRQGGTPVENEGWFTEAAKAAFSVCRPRAAPRRP